MPAAITSKRALARLRTHALAYPEAVEDFPWGDRVIKVRGKIFVFLGAGKDGEFGISAKLPQTHELALTLKYVTPTAYGLGKAGWVTAQLPKGRKIPIDLFEEWIDESYRAVAPTSLVREVDPAAGIRRRRLPAD
jgi:predicted DNA-binding protein (MmcQ/YjbR family)